MKVAAITCTGGRQELLSLTEKWLRAQTIQPDVWLVSVDDGSTPKLESEHTLIRPGAPPPNWSKHVNITPQNWNLAFALRSVPPDHIAIVFEDDDFYEVDHIEASIEALEYSPVVCQPMAFGFYLPQGTFCIHDKVWPTEGMVALAPEAIIPYAKCLPGFRDIEWYKRSCMIRKPTCVQIKGAGRGLPGRAGTTRWQVTGAQTNERVYPDPFYAFFKQCLGDDRANLYLDLLCTDPQPHS